MHTHTRTYNTTAGAEIAAEDNCVDVATQRYKIVWKESPTGLKYIEFCIIIATKVVGLFAGRFSFGFGKWGFEYI